MSCESNVQTTAGTTIAIGPAPGTFDEAGYEAVSVDIIGEITDIGEIGKIFNTASHTPLSGRAVIERKTSYTRQSPTLALAIDEADVGQIAAEAALESDDCYTIKITRQNGDKIYFSAQVSSFTVSFSTDSFENGSITLLPQSDNLKVAAV
jgi:hypothetical protein